MRGMHSRDQMPRRTEQDRGREWAVSVLGGLGQTVRCGSHRVLKLMGALGVDGGQMCTWNGGWMGQCVQSLELGRLGEQDRRQPWPCQAIAKKVARRARELPEGHLLTQGEAGKPGWRRQQESEGLAEQLEAGRWEGVRTRHSSQAWGLSSRGGPERGEAGSQRALGQLGVGSMVWDGVLGGQGAGADVGRLQDKVQLLRLWYHESCRVFRDRLVSDDDRGWFDKLLESCMEQWKVTFVEVCPFQPILYGDFMSPGSDVKSYELITSEKKVRGPFALPPRPGPRPSAALRTDHHAMTRGSGLGRPALASLGPVSSPL